MFSTDQKIAEILSTKRYKKNEGYVLDKNVRTALQMMEALQWDGKKYVISNKELGKWQKTESGFQMLWNVLDNKEFLDIMDKKFKEKKEVNEISSPTEVLITPTEIGRRFGLKGSEVNDIFNNLKLQVLTETGYKILKKDGTTCLKSPLGVVNTAFEKSSIRWNENILNIKIIIEALSSKKGKKVIPTPSAKNEAKTSSTKKATKVFEIDRAHWENQWWKELGRLEALGTEAEIQAHLKKKPKFYRSERGDILRSKNELVFADALHKFDAPYICEEVVKGLEETVLSDFYLPYRYLKDGQIIKLDVYIEYWGDIDEKYEDRKQKKIELYKKAGAILIEYSSTTSEDVYTLLERVFNRHPEIKKTGMTFRELNKAHRELKQMLV